MDSVPRLKSRRFFSFHPPGFVLLPLEAVRFACGDQSNDLVALSVTVAYDESPQPGAKPKKNKPILLLGMVLVWTQQGFLERHAMLPTIHRRLAVVPFKAKLLHALQVYLLRTYMASPPNSLMTNLEYHCRSLRVGLVSQFTP